VRGLESSHIRLFRWMHVSGGLGGEAALHCNYLRLEWRWRELAECVSGANDANYQCLSRCSRPTGPAVVFVSCCWCCCPPLRSNVTCTQPRVWLSCVSCSLAVSVPTPTRRAVSEMT